MAEGNLFRKVSLTLCANWLLSIGSPQTDSQELLLPDGKPTVQGLVQIWERNGIPEQTQNFISLRFGNSQMKSSHVDFSSSLLFLKRITSLFRGFLNSKLKCRWWECAGRLLLSPPVVIIVVIMCLLQISQHSVYQEEQAD